MTTDVGAAASGDKRALRARRKAAELRAAADRQDRLAARLEKGNDGERQVAGLLDVLDGAGWVVLNDRYKSAASPVNIDHIVVGPPGVVVVDSKNWSGAVRLDDRGMSQNGYRRDTELLSARTTADAVQWRANEFVPGVTTTAVLAFVQDVGIDAPVLHRDVTCLQAPALLPWLTTRPSRLTPQEVQRLASSLDAAFPPRSGSAKPLTVASAVSRPKPAANRRKSVPPARRPTHESRASRRVRQPAPSAKGVAAGLGEAAFKLVGLALFLVVVLPLLLQALTSGLEANLVEPPVQPPAAPAPPAVPAP